MTQVIIDRRQVGLEYATDCMIVRAKDLPPRTLPLNRITRIVCMHSVGLTTQLIGQLQKRGIDFVVLNQRHASHSFALYGDQRLLVERRCRQYALQLDDATRLPLAIELCRHKFNVLHRLLQTYPSTGGGCQQIRRALDQLASCQDDQQLRGYEGSVQKMAFQHWRQLIPAVLGFKNRLRRPPPDPVNAALSFAYTLVHQDAVRQAIKHALDPQLGIYHRLVYGRQSLACDLMEPVRPKVESWVAHLFIEGVLDRRHFSLAQGRCLLGKAGREIFYKAFDEQVQDWQRQLGATARWLARQCDSDLQRQP